MRGNSTRAGDSVHPRARGDGNTPPCRSASASGSPPRARGRRYALLENVPGHRFTPARAGTATETSSLPLDKSVHPRARGDGDDDEARFNQGDGSPPRARGRLGVLGQRF